MIEELKMPDVHLEGTIWLYKKKVKIIIFILIFYLKIFAEYFQLIKINSLKKIKDVTILMNYVITFDKNNDFNNKFVLFNDKNTKVRAIKIGHIERLSQFNDHSWQMFIKGKKCFRFKGITEDENTIIYDTINKIINHKIDEMIDNFSSNHDTTGNNSIAKLWSLKIDPDLTSPHLLEKFSIENVYILKIDCDKIVLENESKTINIMVIPFR